MRLKNFRAMTVLFVLFGCMWSNAHAQNEHGIALSTLPRQFTATAFGQSGSMTGKSFGFDFYITAWTTDEQVHSFVGTLKEKGPDAPVKAMAKASEVGRSSPTGYVGSSFSFARYTPTANGGLHIVLASDRPMSFVEVYHGTRSRDYPFGIAVLDVDKDGKGTGTLAPMCKIRFNKKEELEIEHFGQKPFRLANVNLQK